MIAHRLGSDADLSSKRNVVIHVIESAGRFRRGRCLPRRACRCARWRCGAWLVAPASPPSSCDAGPPMPWRLSSICVWSLRPNRVSLVHQMRRRLHRAPRVARGAVITAFGGIGDEVVMPAVITGGPGKTVGRDAAFEVFTKRLAYKALGRVVVALPIKLACTYQLMPCFKKFDNCPR